MEHHPVVIVGAGLAGLTCAHYLNTFRVPFTLLEASDDVGGRMRTDYADGFLLDRGFHIFLTAYREAKRVLDYEALQLKTFRSGAIVRRNNRFVRFTNPLREPTSLPQSLLAPIGSLSDKLHILQLTSELDKLADDEIWRERATSTLTYLSGYGWSEKMIRNFFQPFFGGVFLEKELLTSSNLFRFLFQQFYLGDAALPSAGIGAIPKQLAARLPAGSIRTGVRVRGIEAGRLYLENGESLQPPTVVLATDATHADQLLGKSTRRDWNGTACLYFAAAASPLRNRMLVINAETNGLINNLCVPSDIAPSYAPPGSSLVSVSVTGNPDLSDELLLAGVQAELTNWFGTEAKQWRHLRTYRLPEALPRYEASQPELQPLKVSEHLYQCGDHVAYPAQNGAMLAGRRVAELIAGVA